MESMSHRTRTSTLLTGFCGCWSLFDSPVEMDDLPGLPALEQGRCHLVCHQRRLPCRRITPDAPQPVRDNRGVSARRHLHAFVVQLTRLIASASLDGIRIRLLVLRLRRWVVIPAVGSPPRSHVISEEREVFVEIIRTVRLSILPHDFTY